MCSNWPSIQPHRDVGTGICGLNPFACTCGCWFNAKDFTSHLPRASKVAVQPAGVLVRTYFARGLATKYGVRVDDIGILVGLAVDRRVWRPLVTCIQLPSSARHIIQ
ncbi:uncharacterized protein PV07_10271 [Cladophialophora immunda]|uniref:Uncharacterized protein n=1 Tax=Cladophialophora immunda TaxID=569365 RepID=A0A0D2AI44_9EURO|nr:uncharacterized protein PV07_10271 [Cladophialophora immunda]KIW24562.1 hypothetical protein PV07_10271 [Cladophialophora immunda]